MFSWCEELAQPSRGTKKKERRGKPNDKTNAIYETTDAQTKKNCYRGTTLERSVEKKKPKKQKQKKQQKKQKKKKPKKKKKKKKSTRRSVNQFYSREIWPLILMQF